MTVGTFKYPFHVRGLLSRTAYKDRLRQSPTPIAYSDRLRRSLTPTAYAADKLPPLQWRHHSPVLLTPTGYAVLTPTAYAMLTPGAYAFLTPTAYASRAYPAARAWHNEPAHSRRLGNGCGAKSRPDADALGLRDDAYAVG